ncbi:MAG: hypothetical protein Q4D14_00160 [Bacteroidales bacterium]|nr:hypothetical protein [Bacteroidales bacterium]
MKKYLSLVLFGLVSMVFAACNNPGPEPEPEPNPNDTTEVVDPTGNYISIDGHSRAITVAAAFDEWAEADYYEWGMIFYTDVTLEELMGDSIHADLDSIYAAEIDVADMTPSNGFYTSGSYPLYNYNSWEATNGTASMAFMKASREELEGDVEGIYVNSGNLVFVNNNDGIYEITITATGANGEAVKIHYKGEVSVLE